jgi:hypothetical protein
MRQRAAAGLLTQDFDVEVADGRDERVGLRDVRDAREREQDRHQPAEEINSAVKSRCTDQMVTGICTTRCECDESSPLAPAIPHTVFNTTRNQICKLL